MRFAKQGSSCTLILRAAALLPIFRTSDAVLALAEPRAATGMGAVLWLWIYMSVNKQFPPPEPAGLVNVRDHKHYALIFC